MTEALAVKPEKNAKAETIGHGSYTASMLNSWKKMERRLIARGHTQEALDFVYATTICPKGHDDFLTLSAAKEKFYPNVTTATAQKRGTDVMKDFMQQLFSGQIVDECTRKWEEAHKKTTSTGTGSRPRLSIEEKAERIAQAELNREFRRSKGLGTKGVLSKDFQEEYDRHLEKYLENAKNKVIADLQK